MDSTRYSELIGRYFRDIVREQTQKFSQAVSEGKVTKTNPFTGEEVRLRIPAAISQFASSLTARGLTKDPAFMADLAAVSAELAEAPVRCLLRELNAFEENGEGGPDPEFTLASRHGFVVQMKSVVSSFEKAVDRTPA